MNEKATHKGTAAEVMEAIAELGDLFDGGAELARAEPERLIRIAAANLRTLRMAGYSLQGFAERLFEIGAIMAGKVDPRAPTSKGARRRSKPR